MENNQQQQLQGILAQLEQLIALSLSLGVPVASISHAINGSLSTLEDFYLDDDQSAQMASRSHRALGA